MLPCGRDIPGEWAPGLDSARAGHPQCDRWQRPRQGPGAGLERDEAAAASITVRAANGQPYRWCPARVAWRAPGGPLNGRARRSRRASGAVGAALTWASLA